MAKPPIRPYCPPTSVEPVQLSTELTPEVDAALSELVRIQGKPINQILSERMKLIDQERHLKGADLQDDPYPA